jgi:integrase
MSVALRRQRDGKLRPYWYGEYVESNGRRKVINLGEWQGTPPPSLLGTGDGPTGDAAFEQSRRDAEKALQEHASEAGRKGRAEHLIERLIESKTGKPVEHVRIADLADRWLSMPRGAGVTPTHAASIRAACERFRAFMARRNPAAVALYEVTAADAGAFSGLLERSLAPRTAHGQTALLRSAFRRFLPSGVANPFAGIVNRHKGENGKGETIHRRPFTPEELRRVLESANGDGFMGGLITAAACTGMRRGDVCGLRWRDVDLAGGMVTAKASKTGEAIEVPIFAPLRTVLEGRGRHDKEYVFPDAARMLRENPDGLTYRFKAIVAKALDPESAEDRPVPVPAAEIESEGAAAIAERVPEGERRERMRDTLRRYAGGESVRQIEKATGRARATVSVDLANVETWTGKRFVRSGQGPGIKAAIARVTRTEREHGQRAASVRDWHALRTTFVTLALSAGVPMELVRRVTGHTTVDIVLRHYFRPSRADFKAALVGALPDVLTGGTEAKAMKPAEELKALSEKLAAGTATEKDKARFRKLAAKV